MGRKVSQILSLFLWLGISFTACKKDKPGNSYAPVGETAGSNLLVVCEGSLGNGNSSLGLYNFKSGTVTEDIFKSANAGQVLGDVFQSMTLIDNRYFLCINNSDKVVVINKSDYKMIGSINVPKPRYILNINPSKAYVSSLFDNKLYIINPSTLELTGSIAMPFQNPEAMLLHNGKVYVTTWDTACNKLYRININSDVIEAEIPLAGYAPQGVLADANDNLWVLSGNVTKGKTAAFTCLSPTGDILKSYQFPAKADPLKPVFNTDRNTIYFIEVNYNGGTDYNGIYKLGINEDVLPSAPLINATKFQYFWALGINPADGRIYAGDPKGFVQKGVVYVYDTQGQQVNQFSVGVGPGHFYFD